MIPVNEPKFTERELELVTDCVKTGWVSSAGQYITEFEEKWAGYCGRKYGVAVSSGTAALHLAVLALGIGKGDEIIMPTFTIISCATAAVTCGAVPVLVDSDPETWCMDTRQIEAKITPRTRAIMPVHIYGHPVDMDAVSSLADKHGLAVIEDAAEAHGAEYLSGRNTKPEWRRAGSFGNVSVFSFYANKLVTTGEGGMLLTDEIGIAEKARSLRNLCFQEGVRFLHSEIGYNYRLTNMQAALGLAQVERMDEIVERKRWMGNQYTKRLKGKVPLKLPPEKEWARSVFWMYGVELTDDCAMDAAAFAAKLADHGIASRPFFIGMHKQPVFLKQDLFKGEEYPEAERMARRGLYLPSGLALTEEQIEEVTEAVIESISNE